MGWFPPTEKFLTQARLVAIAFVLGTHTKSS
jgi:hypothetical protein